MCKRLRKSLLEYFHRTEKRAAVEAILLTWSFNLVTAFLVFNMSWYASGDAFVTVMYTLSAWTITLSMSIAYWLSWVFNRMKTKERVKIIIASIVIFMYMMGLLIVWNTFLYVMGLLL
jgi:predicted metallopeptidase